MLEHEITHRVAVSVVKGLEMVDVHHEQRHRPLIAFCAFQLLGELFLKMFVVMKLGKAVGDGKLFHPVIEPRTGYRDRCVAHQGKEYLFKVALKLVR